MPDVPGWELVEMRADGRWYTIDRSYAPSAYTDYWAWVNGNPTRRVLVRKVLRSDPTLSASINSQRQVATEQENEANMSDIVDTARGDGYRLAAALSQTFQVKTTDARAVFALARVMAKQAGYRDIDPFDAFLDGFGNGFTVSDVRSIPAPADDTSPSKE